jgi:hydroxymethylbilane synthase
LTGADAPPRLLLACGADRLARQRAESLAAELRQPPNGVEVELVPVAGGGTSAPGLTAALRDAVLSRTADAAVHAWPDLPWGGAQGLVVVAVPSRADARDCLVTRTGRVMAYLPKGAAVGCVEPRQEAQLRRRRTDLAVVQLGADTVQAMDRLDGGEVDGLVVRVSDLDWLGWADRIAEFFDTDQMIPAPGQGALAVEARAGDHRSAELVAAIDDPDTAYAVLAERTCAARLHADRQSPVGIFAVTDGASMFIHGIVATPDGSRAARLRWSGPKRAAEEVGDTLAELLESVGALDILSGGELPPSIRDAERRRQLIEDLEDEEPEPESPHDG